MEQFPGNSYQDKKSKPERPKLEKVTTSQPRTRKKPLGKKLSETFTSEDTGSVGNYILFDVVIPAAKTMVSDAVSQGIERLLFGDTSRPIRSSTKGYTPYNRASAPVRGTVQTSGRRDISQRARNTHDFNEVVLDTRGEAEEVLDRLTDLIKDYDHATVADMYDLVGVTGSFTDDRWGWTTMAGAHVARLRDGYILAMPKPEPID